LYNSEAEERNAPATIRSSWESSGTSVRWKPRPFCDNSPFGTDQSPPRRVGLRIRGMPRVRGRAYSGPESRWTRY